MKPGIIQSSCGNQIFVVLDTYLCLDVPADKLSRPRKILPQTIF